LFSARTTIIAALLVSAAGAALAQPIGGGVKIGRPLSDAFTLEGAGFRASNPGYTVGPFMEVRFPPNLALEFAALYEKLEFEFDFGRPGLERQVSTTTASSWQFPLVLKYRFGRRRVRPFIEGGVAAYYIANVEETGEVISQLPSEVRTAFRRAGNSFANGGGVMGGGVEIKLGLLRIAPEVRFTRWAVDQSVGTDAVSLRLNQSRTHFLLGLSF
jgi:hypothetical protein